MKFERVLQIYWTKGFFYSGRLFYTNISIDDFFEECPGLNRKLKSLLYSRYELTRYYRRNRSKLISEVEADNNIKMKHTLNILLSQVTTVNNPPIDLIKIRIIRLYLIKTYKGKCHALGKPVHGQRTWSNAWGSYKNNTILRDFISEVKKNIKPETKVEKIDYRNPKQKFVRKKKPIKLVKKAVRKSTWF